MTSPPTWNQRRTDRIRAGQSACPSLLSRMVLNVVLPWILSAVIVAVVAVVCRFAEEGPRSDDPPDTGEEPELLPIAALRVPLDDGYQ